MRLLIADSSEGFARILAQQLRKSYEVRTASDGLQALALLRRFRPELMVLDLSLAQMDGITLLQAARVEGLQPEVLAVAPVVSDYVSQQLQQLQVSYLVTKPCSISFLVARLLQMSHRLQEQPPRMESLERRIVDMLQLLGAAPHLSGTRYLQKAIALKVHLPSAWTTKEIYPVISKEFAAGSPELVERSIRNAIETAWKNRCETLWQYYFPPGTGGTADKPSNTEFISRLAQLLELT